MTQLVVNASPLIFMSKINGLSLLAGCFTDILTPPAVVQEIRHLALPAFIQQIPLSPEGMAYVKGAKGRLHAGELETIVLAQEQGITHVALDDLLARNKAKQLGLTSIGTAGLLLLAKTKGLIDALTVKIKIHELTHQHGLYLSLSVLKTIEAKLSEGSPSLHPTPNPAQ